MIGIIHPLMNYVDICYYDYDSAFCVTERPVVSIEELASPSRPRGRRAGAVGVREQILDAATEQFGELGYQAATVRRIAAAAGVDAKLVHYYFGGKADLFAAVIAEAFASLGVPEMLDDSAQRGAATPGTRYLYAILSALEESRVGPACIGLVRNLGSHEESRRIFLRFVTEQLIDRLAPRLEGDFAETRVALTSTHILGIVLARYVLQVPTIASLSREELARAAGPTVDRYMFGDAGLPVPGSVLSHDEVGPA